jgi:hypothetical protein
MDDATLVKIVAAQYLRDMGSGAIRYLREMQELAASLSDADSAGAWRDIEDMAQAMLLTVTPDSSRSEAQAALCVAVPLG